MSSVTSLEVGLDFGSDLITVGRLAERDHRIFFEYDSSFIEKGMEISPFTLPLSSGVLSGDRSLFEGLPGVFNDSLPDGWGRLLFDRAALSRGILPSEISVLERLSSVGSNGIGALVYRPETTSDEQYGQLCLDTIARDIQSVLQGSAEEVLNELIELNGSFAGARPKTMIGVSEDYEYIMHGRGETASGFHPWLVKFPNTQDGLDAGAIEYVYALMAQAAGVDMPATHLFPSDLGPGFFAVRRFDRDRGKRVHVHSVSGLLHADHRVPSLDYADLLQLTFMLTKDAREVEKMYRLAVFNVLAHNRDDHAKNFSFLMSSTGTWTISPAYDLTFSSGPSGEQSTMVMGEGRDPGEEHLLLLGREADISAPRMKEIIEQTKSALTSWYSFAAEHGVSHTMTKLIGQRLGLS